MMTRTGSLTRLVLGGCAMAAVGLAGCDSPTAGMCSRDADCPGGERCADGVCTPTLQREAGPPDRGGLEARLDGKPPTADRMVDGAASCRPNHDERIDRGEMIILAGPAIKYTVGSGLTLNLQGSKVAGRTEWDLTANAADEHPYLAELEPVASWAAPDYPGATYMSLLDADLATYGVFKATSTALQLIGVISKTPSDTKLSYSSAVDTLRFPVAVKDSFQTGAVVTGTMASLPLVPISIYESYDVSVLDAGALKLPELTLDVLLVKVVVKQNPTVNPFYVTTRTSFLFVAECYGIVAQIFTDGEPASLASVLAKERRRISK
jgi:hypothetical protein